MQKARRGTQRKQTRAKREPNETKGSQKGTKREPKGAKREQSGSKREQKGSQSEPKGSQKRAKGILNEPKGFQNAAQNRCSEKVAEKGATIAEKWTHFWTISGPKIIKKNVVFIRFSCFCVILKKGEKILKKRKSDFFQNHAKARKHYKNQGFLMNLGAKLPKKGATIFVKWTHFWTHFDSQNHQKTLVFMVFSCFCAISEKNKKMIEKTEIARTVLE